MMIFNDDEIRGNGDEPELSEVTDDAYELMRSGYYEVEKVELYENDN
jgi:hypothetical protein